MTAVVCAEPCRIRAQPCQAIAAENTITVSGVSSRAARLRAGGISSTNTCSPKCAPRFTAAAAPRKTSQMKQARATSSYQTKVRSRT